MAQDNKMDQTLQVPSMLETDFSDGEIHYFTFPVHNVRGLDQNSTRRLWLWLSGRGFT